MAEAPTPTRVLVTGSSGFLGSKLMARLRDEAAWDAVGLDVVKGPHTTIVGSIVDAQTVASAMATAKPAVVFHTATLHKPHIASHSKRDFVDVNVTGTLNVVEAAAASNASVVFTSSTSAYGEALKPTPTAPAAWIDETLMAPSKNVYGATKVAAEDLCRLISAHERRTRVVVLRTSRFFHEEDDDPAKCADFPDDANLKTLEFLHRRVHVDDVVEAHLLAARRLLKHARDDSCKVFFDRYIISAPTPFSNDAATLAKLRADFRAVLVAALPDDDVEGAFDRLGWKFYAPGAIDRVYSSEKAVRELGWRPRWDFAGVVRAIHHQAGDDDRRVAEALFAKMPGHTYHPQG